MINFSKDDLISFLKRRPVLIAGVVIILASIGGFFFQKQIVRYFKTEIIHYPDPPEVKTPTIIRGDLVLPKVMLDRFNADPSKDSVVHVLTANLFGVFDSPQQSQNPFAPPPEQKLVGIRILGEMVNTGKLVVEELSPVIRFLDENNVEIASKLGRLSPGFDFFGVLPGGTTVYDVIVDDPPQADKMEIVLNVQSATTSGKFDLLKVLNQNMDVKTAVNQNPKTDAPAGPKISSDSALATDSGALATSGGQPGSEGEEIPVEPLPEKIEYYTVSGSVTNSLTDPVSDITVYVWIKDKDNHVFSFGRQDFKGDLIAPKKTVDFKINLFPFKDNVNMEKYEVKAWGKRYKL